MLWPGYCNVGSGNCRISKWEVPLSSLRLVFGVVLFFSLPALNAAYEDEIKLRSSEIEGQVVQWRRFFHEYPELSNREFETSKFIANELNRMGFAVEEGVGKTGVVAVLPGRRPGKVLALRADMDALPVNEMTGLSYASKVMGEYEGRRVGVMHACGHDNHMAILLGAAHVLSGFQDRLKGKIKFIFQPAEEGPPKGETGGASLMIEEGVLKNPEVSAIFGLHISQGGVAGTASYRPGGFMASAQRFDLIVKGVQTHGSMPWAGVDPILVGSQIVNALQTIVSRRVDITKHPVVISVGSFHAGVRNNIIPDQAVLSGTIRTYDADVRSFVHRQFREIANNIAESQGAEAELTINRGVPVTRNDEALTAAMLPSLQKVYGINNVSLSERITGAEDFSFYQEQIPGFFFFIGGRPSEISANRAIPNHSPYFYIDEAALVDGVRAMSQLALDYLKDG